SVTRRWRRDLCVGNGRGGRRRPGTPAWPSALNALTGRAVCRKIQDVVRLFRLGPEIFHQADRALDDDAQLLGALVAALQDNRRPLQMVTGEQVGWRHGQVSLRVTVRFAGYSACRR